MIFHRSCRPSLPYPLLALALASPLAALAQDASTVARPSAVTLDAVEVTAQRRVENIQDVPVSISIVPAQTLEAITAAAGDVRVLSGRVPSLNIESSFGRAFPRFYIRGLGNTDFDLNASQPVSLVYDDVVQENPILKGFPMFDLERVEVLRGPQGTLFGRNSPAGVVKFESVRPSQEAGGHARVALGDDGLWNVETAYGGGLAGRWSARVSLLYQRRDDTVENIFPGAINDGLEGFDESAARVQFLYEGEDFEGLFNLHGRHLNGTARVFRANIIQPGGNDTVPGFDRDRVALDGRNFSELDSRGGSARLRWDLGDHNLYSITGYETVETINRGDIDGGYGAVFLPPELTGPGVIPFASESADGLPDHRQITQEFRVESDYGQRFEWQAGLFWFDEDLTVDSFNYDSLSPGNPRAGHAVQTQRNKAWAVFASGEFEAAERFTLRGGLRYTRDEKEFSATVLEGAPFGAPAGGPYDVSLEDSKVSWDLSGVYEASDTVNVYARVATGFRAPSIQGRLLFADPAAPNGGVTTARSEDVISYEAGIKADLWDRRARLGFNVFRYQVDDQQLIAVGGEANIATLLNAARTRGQGVELDLEAWLTDALRVSLGSSYNDTEIRDPGLSVAGCAQCTITDPPVLDGAGQPTGRYDIDGNPLPQSPRWIHSLTARWGVPVAAGEFFVFTDWAYRSQVHFFLYESPEFTGRSSLEGGLRLGYNWAGGEREVAVFGRNITDQTRIVGGIDFNNLTGFLNEPRTLGVEFTARF